MDSNQERQIDRQIFTQIVHKVYQLERENFKTKRFRDNEMVDKVRKIIEFEVDRNEN